MIFWRTFATTVVISTSMDVIVLLIWDARLPMSFSDFAFPAAMALFINFTAILLFCAAPAYLAKRTNLSDFTQMLIVMTSSAIGGYLIFHQIGVREEIMPVGALFGALASMIWIAVNLRFLNRYRKVNDAQ